MFECFCWRFHTLISNLVKIVCRSEGVMVYSMLAFGVDRCQTHYKINSILQL